MSFDLNSLNPKQKQAAEHTYGPLLVLAGAGSGKTRVITYRIARLIHEGVNPKHILGMTFTNKAANEMRERLIAIVGKAARKVTLSTFHALGLHILKEELDLAGLRPGFTIYDTADQMGLVRELMRRTKVSDRRLDVSKVLYIILKTKRERLETVEIDWGDDYEFAAYELYPSYVEQMKAFNAIDFDDLMLKSQEVLENEAARERWGKRYRFLLVDEYQDTSPDQLTMVQALAGESQNVCAVGDDDQSIYAFRGAAADSILAFGKQFAGTTEVILDQNYRSTSAILNAANAVISNNKVRKEKVLWSANGDGEPVEVVRCVDAEDEAEFVAQEIQRLLGEGFRHDEVAVLYRANVQARLFEEALNLEHIPYRVVGGQSFFDRKEVRDAAAFLSLATNNDDELSLRRIINVPPRGVGPKSLEKIFQQSEKNSISLWEQMTQVSEVEGLSARAHSSVVSLVSRLTQLRGELEASKNPTSAAREFFDDIGLKDSILDADDPPKVMRMRIDNLEQVFLGLERAVEHGESGTNAVQLFLRRAALDSSSEEEEKEGSGKVTLMTLHSSKGLEFPYVFFVGLEEEILPHRRSIEDGSDISEERRLCYVGMTRAKLRLWLTYAALRRRHGRDEERSYSRFIEEMGDKVMRWSRDEGRSVEDSEALAQDFFAKMREQLGD